MDKKNEKFRLLEDSNAILKNLLSEDRGNDKIYFDFHIDKVHFKGWIGGSV